VAQDVLGVKTDAALKPAHEADDIGCAIAQGHEVDDMRDAAIRASEGFEDKRAVAIASRRQGVSIYRAQKKAAVEAIAKQRGETRAAVSQSPISA
jgi:hypothetical protein